MLPTPTPPIPSTPTGGGLTVPDFNAILIDGTQRMVGYYNQINTDGYFTAIQAVLLLAIVIFGVVLIMRAFAGQEEGE